MANTGSQLNAAPAKLAEDSNASIEHGLFSVKGGTVEGVLTPFSAQAVSSVPGVTVIHPSDDGTDQSAYINDAIANSTTDTIVIPEGNYWISHTIFVPPGKTLMGMGQDKTIINVLDDFGPLPGHGAITVESATLSDLSVDVHKTNLGEGSSLRVCGVIGTGTDFFVENVNVKNATAYAFWGNGIDPRHALASGTFQDCYAENSNCLFETTRADGVTFLRCVGADGDGDIVADGVFHPASLSSNVLFEDCYYTGRGSGVSAVANLSDQLGLVFRNVHVATTGTGFAIITAGPYMNEMFFYDCTFTAQDTNAAQFDHATVQVFNSTFESSRIAVAVLNGTVEMTDSVAVGRGRVELTGATFGLYSLGQTTWNGGILSASGVPGSAAVVGNATVSPETDIILGELGTAAEHGTVVVNTPENDHVAAPAPNIVAIEGHAVAVGDSVLLASGARVTLQADGSLRYDVNGAFASLAAPESGASNTSAPDVFTYTLTNGVTAAARITVTGVASPEDQFAGTPGNDVLTGDDLGHAFLMMQGGNDTVTGGAGNDVFYFGGAFTGADKVNGGAGDRDVVVLQGNYALTLSNTNLAGIEILSLQSGANSSFGDTANNLYDFDLTMADGNVAAGQQLVVDAQSLGVGEDFTFNGSAEHDGSFVVYGGRGVDSIKGGDGNDAFLFSSANGSSTFSDQDKIDGRGGAQDVLILEGSVSVRFKPATLTSVETIVLHSNNGRGYAYYNLMPDDGNLGAATLTVDGSALRYGESLMFYGYNEMEGRFDITGGASNDYLFGGHGSDSFHPGLGNDYLNGLEGGDNFYFPLINGVGTFSAADHVDGGANGVGGGQISDVLYLSGRLSVNFNAGTISNIEEIRLASADGKPNAYYNFQMKDGNVAAGATMTVSGQDLRFGEALMFYGQNETDGSFVLEGGASNDYLIGGRGADVLQGNGGRDYLKGNAGADLYLLSNYSVGGPISSSTSFDTIVGFDRREDHIGGVEVTSFGGDVNQGRLAQASFDQDLAAAMNGVLGSHQAALFTPDQGDYAGRTFLLIDGNQQAGYQAGADYVVELVTPVVPLGHAIDYFG
jgi:Ca2+-binding RTX toxin-like protein